MSDLPDRFRMTPGPTEVPDAVGERMAEPLPNPDVEPAFFEFYRDLTGKLERVYYADRDGAGESDVVVLGGEGILGLEAAIASLVAEGDRVLCLSNGRYGDGFADFVDSYGGEPVVCEVPWRETLDVDAVAETLERAATEGEPFDVATMVHCETPTGTLNDLEPILDVLDEHGVVSVVDAVSSLGGAPVPTEKIDVCLGASQKCFSAPPGLTTCAISDRAWDRIESVETPEFYLDLEPWKTAADEEWFPYSHLTANLYGLDAAVDLLLAEGLESVFERHEAAARRCRERAATLGLETYSNSEDDCSPTVTAIEVDGRAGEVQAAMLEDHGIVLATGLGGLEDDILRVGHMGHNARLDRVERTMDALAAVLD
ncbi:pyridoxal-phosphate-dependent aminotransferase family protein [Natronobacterium gregoryi]|uniref:Alanine--glyoxylate aminotransferase family protein n=2 Tax=Natronobacterium gregoryi TaxID=44930 RepID=L0ANC3_NATGS|nr:aminotransferase class V-fold PLP-dependent enzyme [Natronobacterium gregoryi]AFZ74687.1 serine-pyruvate aminotransferase/archaeal aspartate aminotransferase [Natronobacterium gregoryi SP2]ELY73408.1 alanine--glyoxylate transaminase [Natronobacterium gregoryi SP2]PLK20932.1 alanine--glyoxylate aminotransferase family protein [Natronobacterium gregoryi SP2]SFJ04834.1 aspartate aminotransferase [Natronobacterium gregoryi]